MKTKLFLFLLAPLGVFAAPASSGPGNANGRAAGSCPAGIAGCPLASATVATPSTLSASELIAAVEEERMARDLYLVAAQRWSLRVFDNIAPAEGRHADAFVRLAASASVAVPAAQAGVYASADIARLYGQLLPLMTSSPESALRAGALLEETNLADLRHLKTRATDAPTLAVLTQLERASQQHLSAFVRTLQASGVSYAPQVLSPTDFAAAIAAGNHPRGQGRGYRGGR